MILTVKTLYTSKCTFDDGLLLYLLSCQERRYWPGRVLGEIFAGCAAGMLEPLPIVVNFWPVLLPFIDPILVPFRHYSLFPVYFVANYRPHLSRFWAKNFLTLKVLKKCDPIIVTLLKMLEKTTPL